MSFVDKGKEAYKNVKAYVEVDNGTFKFVAAGAIGTAAIGLLVTLSHVLLKSDSNLKHKLKKQRMRLLERRRKRISAESKLSNSPTLKNHIFDNLRTAYVGSRDLHKHTGGCHCGRVRFIVEAPEQLDCIDSDRNMHTLKGRFPHVVVPKSRVTLLTSNDHLKVYHFGSQKLGSTCQAFEFQNLFCKTCGVHCFGYNEAKGTMHVNTMCLDMTEVKRLNVAFDSDGSTLHVITPLLYRPTIDEITKQGLDNIGCETLDRTASMLHEVTGTTLPTTMQKNISTPAKLDGSLKDIRYI